VAPSFGYAQPHHLSEAFDILDGYGRDASLLAGGTDLVVGLRKRRIAPRMIVDLKRISDLAPGIAGNGGARLHHRAHAAQRDHRRPPYPRPLSGAGRGRTHGRVGADP